MSFKMTASQLIARLTKCEPSALITLSDAEGYNCALQLFAGERVVAHQINTETAGNSITGIFDDHIGSSHG